MLDLIINIPLMGSLILFSIITIHVLSRALNEITDQYNRFMEPLMSLRLPSIRRLRILSIVTLVVSYLLSCFFDLFIIQSFTSWLNVIYLTKLCCICREFIIIDKLKSNYVLHNLLDYTETHIHTIEIMQPIIYLIYFILSAIKMG